MSEQESINETAKAHAAFLAYCEMGTERSLRKLAEEWDTNGTKTGQITKQLGIWSSKHRWQERVRQYDREQFEARQEAERQTRQEDWDTIRKMLLRHIDSEVEITAGSQIQAGKLLNEHYVVAEEVRQVKAQYEELLAKLKKVGIDL